MRALLLLVQKMSNSPFYPAAFVAASVLNLFAAFTAPVVALWRPLAISMVTAVLAQIVLSVFLRDRHRGALMTLGVLLIIGGGVAMGFALVVTMLALAVAVVLRHGRLVDLPWNRSTDALNAIGSIVLALAIITAAGAAFRAGPPPATSVPTVSAGSEAPDIFLLLLDGYPRADTLASDFGIDNGPFLEWMGRLGFEVAVNSHSNYNMTILTLASMLNGEYVDSLVPEPPTATVDQYRALQASINGARGLSAFRDAGYEIVTIPSTSTTTALVAADRYLDTGEVTDFELTIMQNGQLPWVLPDFQREILGGSHREGIREAITMFGGLGRPDDARPRFVLAHVMAPHAPYLLQPAGASREPWPCFPTSCNLWLAEERSFGHDAIRAALSDQLGAINELVLRAVREILESNGRESVIIVMSDHGHRHSFSDGDEMLRSLFLARTPGRQDLFPEDVTPVEVLPTLLNAYLGTELPLLPAAHYLADLKDTAVARPLDLIQWEPGD